MFFLDCSEGSNLTPAHHFPDFRFKTYAPVAFRYFRELFGIRPDDYLVRSDKLFHLWNDVSCGEWIKGSRERESRKSGERKDVRARVNKHETGGWGVWGWEGRIEHKKLRRERKDRSAACHPSLGRRSRRLHDSSLCPEPLSRTHTACLVGIPACSMSRHASAHQPHGNVPRFRISANSFQPVCGRPSPYVHTDDGTCFHQQYFWWF